MEDLPIPQWRQKETSPAQTVQLPAQGREDTGEANTTLGKEAKMDTPQEDAQSTAHNSDEGTADCIEPASETKVGGSDNDMAAGGIDIAEEIDPSYLEDINSELQDQGIGIAKDQFSTQVQIISHTLKKGKLSLHVKLGSSAQATNIDWKDLRVDVPAALTSYILQHGIGLKSSEPKSQRPIEWAKGYMPKLRRAMINLTQTYGVSVPGLVRLIRVLRNKLSTQVSSGKHKRSI
jgi:hypothetical protein